MSRMAVLLHCRPRYSCKVETEFVGFRLSMSGFHQPGRHCLHQVRTGQGRGDMEREGRELANEGGEAYNITFGVTLGISGGCRRSRFTSPRRYVTATMTILHGRCRIRHFASPSLTPSHVLRH